MLGNRDHQTLPLYSAVDFNTNTSDPSLQDHTLWINESNELMLDDDPVGGGSTTVPGLDGDVILSNGAGDMKADSLLNYDGTTLVGTIDALSTTALWSGFQSWDSGSVAPFYSTSGDILTMIYGGVGYIHGVRVEWSGPQSIVVSSDVETFIGISAAGVLISTTHEEMHEDNVNLVYAYYSNSAWFLSAETHHVNTSAITVYHTQTIGSVVVGDGGNISPQTDTIGADTDFMILVTGDATLLDSDLRFTIEDSASLPIDVALYWAGGYYDTVQIVPALYDLGGVLTAPTSTRETALTIYAVKNRADTQACTYAALFANIDFANKSGFRAAVEDGTLASATSTILAGSEYGRLGYVLVSTARGIIDTIISKAFVGSDAVIQAGSSEAINIRTDETQFSGVLSVDDTNVQVALETVDQMLAADVLIGSTTTPTGTTSSFVSVIDEDSYNAVGMEVVNLSIDPASASKIKLSTSVVDTNRAGWEIGAYGRNAQGTASLANPDLIFNYTSDTVTREPSFRHFCPGTAFDTGDFITVFGSANRNDAELNPDALTVTNQGAIILAVENTFAGIQIMPISDISASIFSTSLVGFNLRKNSADTHRTVETGAYGAVLCDDDGNITITNGPGSTAADTYINPASNYSMKIDAAKNTTITGQLSIPNITVNTNTAGMQVAFYDTATDRVTIAATISTGTVGESLIFSDTTNRIYVLTSSIRYKLDVNPVKSGFSDYLTDVDIKTFSYKELMEYEREDDREIVTGIIAEELHALNPDACVYNHESEQSVADNDWEEFVLKRTDTFPDKPAKMVRAPNWNYITVSLIEQNKIRAAEHAKLLISYEILQANQELLLDELTSIRQRLDNAGI